MEMNQTIGRKSEFRKNDVQSRIRTDDKIRIFRINIFEWRLQSHRADPKHKSIPRHEFAYHSNALTWLQLLLIVGKQYECAFWPDWLLQNEQIQSQSIDKIDDNKNCIKCANT